MELRRLASERDKATGEVERLHFDLDRAHASSGKSSAALEKVRN